MEEWLVLKDERIIKYIIGDEAIIKTLLFDFSMPYMSGNYICELSNKLGLNQFYDSSNKSSRKIYMEKLIEYVVINDMVNMFFKEILSLKRFKNEPIDNYHGSAIEYYSDMTNNFMSRINERLFFYNCYMDYNFKTWKFVLKINDEEIIVESNDIKNIGKEYVRNLQDDIFNAINNSDYDSSITKSRNLIDEILVHGIEQKGIVDDSKGNIHKRYNLFKTHYNMHQNKDIDKVINELLSGLEKIIASISEMRNLNSDSHAAGDKRKKIKRHHAVLIANASITMSDFLLSVISNKKG